MLKPKPYYNLVVKKPFNIKNDGSIVALLQVLKDQDLIFRTRTADEVD
jgi:hypothetical protein